MSGQYFITAWSDTYDVVIEDTRSDHINLDDPNELDNNNYKTRPLTVFLTPPPDLEVTELVTDALAQAGGPVTVNWTVQNNGNSATSGSTWVDRIYLSDEPEVGLGQRQWLLAEVVHQGQLQKGQSYQAETTVVLSPAATGKYIIVHTNPLGQTWEGPLTDNNARDADIQVQQTESDLTVTSIITPEHTFSGELASISWTVTNQGSDTVWPGTRYWTDQVFISPDDTFIANRAKRIGAFVFSPEQPLAPGASYTPTKQVRLPQGIDGPFTIFVQTNEGGTTEPVYHPSNALSRGYFETHAFEDSSNNWLSEPIPVTYREPDLVVTEITVPGTAPGSGQRVPISWTVTNQGGRYTSRSLLRPCLLSRDPSLDENDQLIAEVRRNEFVTSGASYTESTLARLPEGIQGDYYVLVYTDSNIYGGFPPLEADVHVESPISARDRPVDRVMARINEYVDEGNNIFAQAMPIVLTEPADLQVTQIQVPDHLTTSQQFTLNFTVTNVGSGATPDEQTTWDDLIYLSRDQFLDIRADRYLGSSRHVGGLDAGESYERTADLRVPGDLTGPFYVFVVSDPVRYASRPRADVFEGPFEENNAKASEQVILELPPPSDLQVDNIAVPVAAQSGDLVTISWTVSNHGQNPASGTWTDKLYLSADAVWDIHDIPLGGDSFSGSLDPPATVGNAGAAYTSAITVQVPPIRPGSYRIIVRSDIFNQVHELEGEANNRTASADTLDVTVDMLQLGVPLETTLGDGENRVFQIAVDAGQTLKSTWRRPTRDPPTRSSHDSRMSQQASCSMPLSRGA